MGCVEDCLGKGGSREARKVDLGEAQRGEARQGGCEPEEGEDAVLATHRVPRPQLGHLQATQEGKPGWGSLTGVGVTHGCIIPGQAQHLQVVVQALPRHGEPIALEVLPQPGRRGELGQALAAQGAVLQVREGEEGEDGVEHLCR